MSEAYMLRPLIIALALTFGIGTAHAAVTGGAPQKQLLVYRVQHSTYGSLGTYTNTIERNGEETKVTTDGKFSISVFGFSLFSQIITRVETWRGGRIVGFHGVTTRNGETVELSGMAEGDSFVMTTPEGTTAAPATVRIANPWSKEAIEGTQMLTPDRGRLEMVTLNEKEPVTLTIRGRKIRTSHFEVQRGGPRRYEVWLDDTGTPVQFALVSPENTITFTLEG
jgi:Family of unknown function (DUF6134)